MFVYLHRRVEATVKHFKNPFSDSTSTDDESGFSILRIMEIVKLKTYKSIETDLVVLVTEDLGDFFSGVVIIGDDEEKVGTYEYKWCVDAFKPYDAEIILKEKSTQLKKGRKPIKNYSDEELYEVLEKVYENKKQVFGLSYTVIVRRLMDLEKIGENKAKELVKQAREVLLICQREDLKYILRTIKF